MPNNEQAAVDNKNVTSEGGWDAFGNQTADNQTNSQDTWATDTTTTTSALSSQPTFGMYFTKYLLPLVLPIHHPCPLINQFIWMLK